MNTKTFEAIDKLKEVELELHRLKNALEMANRALDAQRTWVGLTDKDWNRSKHNYDFQKGVDWAESILKEKNT